MNQRNSRKDNKRSEGGVRRKRKDDRYQREERYVEEERERSYRESLRGRICDQCAKYRYIKSKCWVLHLELDRRGSYHQYRYNQPYQPRSNNNSQSPIVNHRHPLQPLAGRIQPIGGFRSAPSSQVGLPYGGWEFTHSVNFVANTQSDTTMSRNTEDPRPDGRRSWHPATEKKKKSNVSKIRDKDQN